MASIVTLAKMLHVFSTGKTAGKLIHAKSLLHEKGRHRKKTRKLDKELKLNSVWISSIILASTSPGILQYDSGRISLSGHFAHFQHQAM